MGDCCKEFFWVFCADGGEMRREESVQELGRETVLQKER